MTNKEKYYTISNSDGDCYITEYTKEKLEEAINENHFGDVEFLDSVKEGDTNYWGYDLLIIKGKIVVPKDEKFVIKRVLE